MQALGALSSNIVVGTDFSEGAERALDAALRMAQPGVTRITLLHTCELSAELGVPDPLATPALDDELVRISRQRLADAVARRGGSGVEITGVLRSGRPWEKINNVAAEVGAGLIVIGRTGSGRGAIADLGHVAVRVLCTASRPVLTVASHDCEFRPGSHARDARDARGSSESS
jgi:nucleotide-binding universal stress UspA family protein